MPKYANGSDAYVISDRSGFRYRTKDTRKEWNGLLVGKDEYEEKHPQLEPIRVSPDPQALRNPKPRVEFMDATVEFPIFDLQTIKYKDKLFLQSELGSVTVSTS